MVAISASRTGMMAAQKRLTTALQRSLVSAIAAAVFWERRIEMRRRLFDLLPRWHWRGCELRCPLPHTASAKRGVRTTAATLKAPHNTAQQSYSRSRYNATKSATPSHAAATTQPSQSSPSHSHPRFVDGQLTRDFISASLYSASAGYFNTSNRIYTSPSPSSLPFPALASRDAYYRQLTSLYGEFDDCWLTPVELFKPHYAHTIARWILQQQQQPDEQHATGTLRIVEVGGGNGTCAAGILDYLRERQPALYERTHYTIVDFSTTNRSRQLTTLTTHLTSPTTAAPRIDLLTMSMLDWSEVVEQRVYVIGLEVLDNMPHDKLVQHNHQLYQTHVYSLTSPATTSPANSLLPPSQPSDPNQRFRESYQPVSDPFIREYVEYQSQYTANPRQPTAHSYGSLGNHLAMWVQAAGERLAGLVQRRGESVVWLPTTALHFFHVLHHFMPRHRLLLADFSSLPDTIGGLNAPIVSGRDSSAGGEAGHAKRARTKDYSTYLIEMGAADIFFPTNFELLQHVYNSVRALRAQRDGRAVTTHNPRVLTNYEFMQQYAIEAAEREWIAEGREGRWRSPTQTRGTFDPLLHDYVNVKFLVS